MKEEQIKELLPVYALDGLDADEQRQVEEHLRTCPTCRQELAAYRDTAAQMAYAVPSVEPPARLKHAILNQVQASTASTASTRPQPSLGERLRNFLAQTSLAWAVAALVLLVGLVASNLLLWQQVQRANRPSPDFRVVAFGGSELAPKASGVMVISPDGTAGTLIVDGLPEPGAGKQYQLWLIRDGERTSGGVFSVDAQGYGALLIQAPLPLVSYPDFGITVEPTGGSPGPTSPRVLGGSL